MPAFIILGFGFRKHAVFQLFTRICHQAKIFFSRHLSPDKTRKSHLDFRVDVDQIVNGGCRVKPIAHRFESGNASSSDMRLAARNFEALPKDVIEKIKKQHKGKDDEDK